MVNLEIADPTSIRDLFPDEHSFSVSLLPWYVDLANLLAIRAFPLFGPLKIGRNLRLRHGHYSSMTLICLNIIPIRSFVVVFPMMKFIVFFLLSTTTLVVVTFPPRRSRPKSFKVDLLASVVSRRSQLL